MPLSADERAVLASEADELLMSMFDWTENGRL
jgi:hypothetical protein